MRSSFLPLVAILLGLVYFSSVSVSAQPTWSLCPGGPTDMTINNATLQLANRSISVVLNSTVDEQVTSGAVVALAVTLSGTQIFTENLDWAVGSTLPVNQDTIFYWKYSVSIPSIAPSGAYVVTMTFIDQGSNPLACINIGFSLMDGKMIEEF